jgi:hypothetical protein
MAGNPLENILSYLNPQANRQRLENIGLYQPRGGANPQQPMGRPAAPPTAPGGYSMGSSAPPVPTGPTAPTKSPTGGSARYNRDAVNAIVKQYVDAGYDPKFAAGVAANALVESGGDPNAYNAEEGAFGLFQHRDDRLDNLKALAERRGASATDLGHQISFSIHEFQSFEKAAYDKIMGSVTADSSAADYGGLIDKYWERSDGKARDKRRALASQIYTDFFGADGAGNNIYETENGNVLGFGAELGAKDPMDVEQPRSMGMDAESFKAIFEADPRKAMEILNRETMEKDAAPYPDAILRYVQGNGEQDTTPAEQQTAALSFGTMAPGANAGGGLSMGTTAPAAPNGGGAASGGAGGGAAPNPSAPAEPDPGMIDKVFNKIYGDEDMTDDERTDRKRAVGLALSQGFQMLSRGTPMDLQPIVAQRMELQQARRAAAELKNNAQGVSDMLVASGMPELAQLPYMGESGMNAAMQTLATKATQQTAASDTPFDLPPSVRSAMAQTMTDMGLGGVAEQFMTMPAGEGLQELYQTTLGAAMPSKEGGAGAVTYTPEAKEQLAAQFEKAGNPFAANAIRSGADDKTIGELIQQQSAVAPGIQERVGSAAGEAEVAQAVSANTAEGLASAYEAAGMPEKAAVVRAAGNDEAARKVVDDMTAADIASEEQRRIKERGEAVAALVPEDMEGAAELKAAAKAAQSSEDLNRIYEKIAKDPATTEEKLYELSKKDPSFLSFLTDLQRAKAGADPSKTFAMQMQLNEMNAAAETYKNTMTARTVALQNMEMVRSIATNPDFQSGKLQEGVLIPLQGYLTSILGEQADLIINDLTMTGARLVETVQNSMFAAMTGALKGAISDRETGYIRATLPSVGDTKTQLLAVAQYHVRIAEIQEAEYNAMLEWSQEAEKNGTLHDRKAMIAYIEDKVGDMKVFDQIPIDQIEEWASSPNRKQGEVVQVMRPDGTSTYVPFMAGE